MLNRSVNFWQMLIPKYLNIIGERVNVPCHDEGEKKKSLLSMLSLYPETGLKVLRVSKIYEIVLFGSSE